MSLPLPFEKESRLLSLGANLVASSRAQVERLLADKALLGLAALHQAGLLKRNVDVGFNLFVIISDVYHRENFHSDILGLLINPQGGHGEQDIFLKLFLEFLRERGCRIEPSRYGNAQVEREEGRIDLLIKDETSKRAIIVENKINDAGDMERQLPRYLEYVTGLGYTCDAIIYLCLSGYRGPDTTAWSLQDKKQVKALLNVINAYDETTGDLLNGWLAKCESSSTNLDAKFVLRQYSVLLKKLGGNVMNKPVMEKFYALMQEGENFQAAQSLQAMLADLITFRRDNIVNCFKHDSLPFERVWTWKDSAVFSNCFHGDIHFGVDVWVEEDGYIFMFWDRNDDKARRGAALIALQKMACSDAYTLVDGRYRKRFSFPKQEKELFAHLASFKQQLRAVVLAA